MTSVENLFDPSFHEAERAHALLTHLRAERPVVRCPTPDGEPPRWVVTRHADVLAVTKNARAFRASPPNHLDIPRQINATDPPEHTALRRLVAAPFAPKSVAAIAFELREHAAAAARALRERGSGDFVEEVARVLSMRVLCRILGLPEDDAVFLRDAIETMVHSSDPDFVRAGRTPDASAQEASHELGAYLSRAFERPREGGLLAIIAASAAAGVPLTAAERLQFGWLLLDAGYATTVNAIGGAARALLDHPGELARLRVDAALIDTAIDEILRWTSPIVHFSRWVAEETTLGGEHLCPGERAIVFFPSANRDERAFVDPFRFDVGRTPNPHVAFGAGAQFCVGAPLARLALRVVLEEILMKMDLEPAGPARMLRSDFNAGPKSLPVRVTGARR
ncbi:MAG TPA: cytochrome P450 [Labilithrix sp.]|nr:cytochrome P450 [Labilithrix sp.]